MNKVLENIRKIRESMGYTQEVLAEKLHVTQASYARFERGATKTDLGMVQSVADFFSMSLIDVITYPKKYIDSDYINNLDSKKEIKATLTIEMGKEKKDQIFRFIFGDNDVEILNKQQ